MNAPFKPIALRVSAANLGDPGERTLIDRFVLSHPEGTPFHRPAWLLASAKGTGNRAHALIAERGDAILAYLPLTEVHSPIFGRMLASSGFAVGGGLLLSEGTPSAAIFRALEELAQRLNCPSIELRGGTLPQRRAGWAIRRESHCGFVQPLGTDDEAQLLQVPRKQRAEVRKGLANDLAITVGTADRDRAAHYAVYAESVRNLGTPVFPASLFAEVLDAFADDADILTVWSGNRPVASVLSLYHGGAVKPYWGGGTRDARQLRANDRMYYELMLHARRRGCIAFDFGRSKTQSGAYDFKRNWGLEPEPLSYAQWTAPGSAARDADPTSDKHSARIELWKRLPLPIANLIGPFIARGLG